MIKNKKEGFKICSKCKKEVLLTKEFFQRDKKTKDGFRADCKECKKKSSKEYYHKKIKEGGDNLKTKQTTNKNRERALKAWETMNKRGYVSKKKKVVKEQINENVSYDRPLKNKVREEIKSLIEKYNFDDEEEEDEYDEEGINVTKKKYNRAVVDTVKEIVYFPKNIMQAEDRVKRFREQLKEGNEKLKNMRYLKSIIYKLAGEEEKMKVNLHTLYYRVEENERIIQKLKEESEKAIKQDLELMDY